MNRRDFLKTVGFTAASLAVPGCPSISEQACGHRGEKPNILFIMTDDQGPWAFGAAPDLNARTPNIDRLVAQGARLKNYFVTTPVCSPSRAALITSRYATEVGVPDYLRGKAQPPWSATPFAFWPRILAHAGYQTALIGKWHLGYQDEYHPTKFGYREFAGFRVGGETSKDPNVEIDGKVRQVKGYTPDILTDLSIDFVRRNHDQPFLLSLHFWAPHANTKDFTPDGDRTWLPLSDADWNRFKDTDPVIPDPDYPKLDIPRLKRMTREYLASIAAVDRNLGRLLAVLEELEITRNTVVIFTSDNGYNMGHNGIWHKGNGRWILTDNRLTAPSPTSTGSQQSWRWQTSHRQETPICEAETSCLCLKAETSPGTMTSSHSTKCGPGIRTAPICAATEHPATNSFAISSTTTATSFTTSSPTRPKPKT